MNMERVMRLNKLILLFLLAIVSQISHASSLNETFMPKTRPIMIKAITQEVINITPGRSVKIIFPWVLDKSDSSLPYYARLSSDNIFQMEEKEGQNSILLYTKAIAKNLQGEYTELSVSSHGYHFTFTIIADFNYKRHYSNIVLKLSDAEKMRLLEDEKQRFTESLKNERKEMMKEIDSRAEILALKKVGELSKGSNSSTNIKEETIKEFDNGDELVLYINKISQYGSFSILSVEIENRSSVKPIYLEDIKLLNTIEGGTNKLIHTASDLPPKLQVRQTFEAVVVTKEPIPDASMSLQLTTDRGSAEVTW